MLALYGHPFSSYTWKALIALYANETPFEFRVIDGDHPDHCAVVAGAGPLGKFPVLDDQGNLIFEATCIIEYLAAHHPGPHALLPDNADAAIGARMLDRVFDNYVMNVMQVSVDEHILRPNDLDHTRIGRAREQLRRAYSWIEEWLQYYPVGDHVSLIECAAAPALFYADWFEPIGAELPRLRAWRAHLNALPPVRRCIEDARPFRPMFPLGAPDRD